MKVVETHLWGSVVARTRKRPSRPSREGPSFDPATAVGSRKPNPAVPTVTAEAASNTCHPRGRRVRASGPELFEPGGEADPQGRPEELLDPGVQGPEHAVELVVGDGLVRQLADEEHRVLHTDGEGGAVELEVAPE